jgi:phage baseplate assembly protein V
MAAPWIENAAQAQENGLPLVGVAVAEVVTNLDPTNLGRVKLRLPWLPDVEPWARVASAAAGPDRGFYFLPQPDEEVLVAFANGDVREPYVVGSLWNGLDRPPAKAPTDPVTRRLLRTPAGHLFEFDDAAQTVTVETSTGQRLVLTPEKIELTTAGGSARLSLETNGTVTVKGLKIDLDALQSVTLGGLTVEVKGSAGVKVNGGTTCEVQAALVKIN